MFLNGQFQKYLKHVFAQKPINHRIVIKSLYNPGPLRLSRPQRYRPCLDFEEQKAAVAAAAWPRLPKIGCGGTVIYKHKYILRCFLTFSSSPMIKDIAGIEVLSLPTMKICTKVWLMTSTLGYCLLVDFDSQSTSTMAMLTYFIWLW